MDTEDDGCRHYTTEEIERKLRKRRHIDSSRNNGTSSTNGDSPYSSRRSWEVLERAQSPNFEELARQYPNFRTAWAATKAAQRERGQAAFSSCVTQQFSIQLTRAILQALFRLKLPYLDEDHLCPPIPNRFFYLHWIHTKLLKHVSIPHEAVSNSRGLDIGSGASCIYSMLAARFYRSSMITSEIDPKSVGLARANVAANHLSNIITVLQVPPSHSQQQQQSIHSSIGGPLQRSVEGWFHMQQQQQQQNQSMNTLHSNTNLVLDFVMTNPPFYDPSSMEISTARVGDGRSRTNMTVSEGNYPGGEVGFVTEMIEDSLRMNSNDGSSSFSAAWYSSMLGKKTSLVKLQKLLEHLLGPAHVETTEYGPGQYTRWFLAWTLRQPPAIAIGALCPANDKDSFQVTMEEPSLPQIGLKEVVNRLISFCDSSPGGWDLTAVVRDVALLTTTMTATEYFSANNCEGPAKIVVHIVENMPPSLSLFVDENQKGIEVPESILQVLRGRNNSQFLPDEGHFLVEAEISAVPDIRQGGRSLVSTVHVALSCYRHSLRGGKAIEKIRNSLEGEVCRTNRKWRKIRERQNQQQLN